MYEGNTPAGCQADWQDLHILCLPMMSSAGHMGLVMLSQVVGKLGQECASRTNFMP